MTTSLNPPLVVGGCSTYSKMAWTHLPHWPSTITDAAGCWVRGKKGEEEPTYIDLTASLGAVLLEYTTTPYCIPSLPGPSPLEEQVASLLHRQVPFMERIRFCKNGSDATEAAVRIARAVTGRSPILCNSYHGSHSDLVTATPGKEGGILEYMQSSLHAAPDPRWLLHNLRTHGKRVAAVILEPLTPSCQDWHLEEVREACTAAGCLLILDEIITGWRVREGSAVPSIQADLYCFGKAIGGGAALACLGGKREYMDLLEKQVFMSGTHAGEQVALQMATHFLTRVHETPDCYSFLQEWGAVLGEALQGIVQGYSQRWTLILPPDQHASFIDTLAREGVLVGRDVFPLYSHRQKGVQEQVLQALQRARKEVGV